MSTQTVVDVIVSGSTTTVVDKRVDGVTTVAGEAPVTNVSGQVPDLGVNTDILATQGDILSLTNDVASLRANLIVTGTTLTDEIGVLSGVLISTGNQLNFTINNLSGDLIATGNSLDSLRDILSGNLLDTGQNLQNQISSNDVDIARLEDSTGDLQLNKFDKIGGTISGNIVPSASGSLSIGTPELPFLSGHFHDITISNNTLFIGDVPIHSSNGGIDFQSATGQTIFKDVTIRNLTVTGSETIIDVEHLAVKDNTITLNTGETGAGISLITGGLIIDRGSLTDADILFNEENDRFEFNFPVAIQGSPVVTQGVTGSFITQAKLTETGNTLEGQINTVDGRVDSVVSNLGNTGTTLTNSIDSLSGTTDQSFLSTGSIVDSISGNLITTGANLQTQVNNISTNVGTTGQTLQSQITSNLNNLQSVETNLITTGQTLTNKINSDVSTVSSNLATTGQTLTADILTVSGEINQPFDELSGNLVTTGQTLQTQITSNDSGILENHNNINSTGGLLLTNINTVSSNLVSTGLIVDDVSGNLITTGQNLQADIAIVSGIATGGSAQDFRELSGNLITTGQTLQSQITSNDNDISDLSGNLSTTGQTLTSLLVQTGNFVDILSGNLITTGNLIDSEIAIVSGLVIQNDGDISNLQTATGTLKSLIDTDSVNLISTGNFLNSEIAIVSGIAGGQDVTALSGRVNTLSGNLITTGQTLASDIAIVSGLATGSSSDPALSGKVDTLSGNLITTGQTLQTQITSNDSDISTLTSNLGVTGQTLQTQITSNDSDISTITSNLATTGQTLQTQITSNDSDISTLTSNLVTTGQTLTSEIAIVSGIAENASDEALSGKVDTLSGNLITTGQTLQTQITSNDSDITSLTSNLVTTGQTLTTDITTVSGLIVDNDGDITALKTATGVLKTSTDSNAANLITTGQTLQTQITSNDGDISTLTTNLGTTGQTLQTQITSNDSDISTLTSNLITPGQTLTSDISTVSGLITDNDADITALKSATGVLKTSTDANTTNLITTGQTLQTQITSNDGDITTLTSNLVTTGQTLQTQITSNDGDISTLTTNIGTTGQTLQTQITSNDSDITSLTSNLITTGQSLTTDINTVSGLITDNDADITALKTATGVLKTNSDSNTANLITTGQTLQTQITSNDGDITTLTSNLATTGQTLQTQITSNDGDITTLTSNLVTTGQTLTTNIDTVATNLGTSGQTLQTQITSNDSDISTLTSNLGTTGQTLQTQITSNDSDIASLTTNLGTTGQTLQTQITSNDSDISTLDSTTVKLTTNQSIAGNKIFTNDVTINNLTVTGTEVVVDVENLAVKDNIIEINSGESSAGISRISGGIVIDRGTATNANILYNDANDRFELNFPLAVEGEVVASASNLITTGQTLTTNINTVSTNLGTSGQTLQTQITSNDSDISTLTTNLGTTGQTLQTQITSNDSDISTLTTNLGATGQTLQTQITSNDSDISTLTSNLVTTGQTLQPQITSNDSDISTLTTNIGTTGQTLQTQITSNDSDISTLTSNLVTTGQTLTTNINTVSTNLGTSGQTLQTQITSNDTDITNLSSNLVTTGQTLTTNINTVATNLVTTGQTLTSEIATVSGLIPATVIDGGGTANKVPLWSDANTIGDSVISQSSSKIGIGIASPSNILHVKHADPGIRLEDSSPDGLYGLLDAGGGDFIISADGGAGSANSFISFRVDGTAVGSEKMRITSAGSVGIGTNAPSEKLHIVNSSDPTIRITNTDGGTNDTAAFELGVSTNTAIASTRIEARRQSDGSVDLNFRGAGTTSVAQTSAQMTLDGVSGAVGINTTSPNVSSKLHVYGWTIIQSATNFASLRLQSTTGSWDIDNNNGTFGLQWAGGDKFNITSAGSVGIGTNVPATKLDVYSSSTALRISASGGTSPQLELSSVGAVNWKLRANISSSDFRITKDSTDYLTILSGGNVGIGTNAPAHKFEVYGGGGGTFGAITNRQSANANTDGIATVNYDGGNSSLRLWVDASGNRKINAGTTEVFSFTTTAVDIKQATTFSSGRATFSGTAGADGVVLAGGESTSLSSRLFFDNGTAGQAVTILNNSGGMEFRTAGTPGSSSGVVKMTLNSAGNLGIGTNSPSKLLELAGGGLRLPNGNSIDWNNENTRILGSHNSNKIQFDVGGVSNVLYLSNGSVGIGTNAPSEMLHINKSSGTGSFIRFQDTGGGGVYIGARSNVMELYAGGAERMRIASDGKVGIGTNAPATILEASGTIRSTAFLPKIQLKRTGNAVANGDIEWLGNDDSVDWSIRANYDSGGDNFNIREGTTSRLYIKSGKVGIGTVTPSSNLHVNSEISCGADDNNRAMFGYTPSRFYLGTRQSGTNYLNTVSVTSGKVGIGTGAPANTFEVNGAARITQSTSGGKSYLYMGAVKPLETHQYNVGGMSAIYANSGWNSLVVSLLGPALNGYSTPLEYIKFSSDGTDQITSINGNVGIGEAAPDQKLEVAGAIKSSGAYGFYAGRADTTWASFGTGVPTILLRGAADNSRAGAVQFKEYDGTDTAAIYSTDGTDGYGLVMAAYQGDMKFATGSLQGYKMVILGSGNVGIGTAAPADTLHVYGTGTTAIFESSSANSYISIKEASGGNHVYLGNQNGLFVIQTPGSSYSTKFQVKSDGNVGVGVSPSTRLHVLYPAVGQSGSAVTSITKTQATNLGFKLSFTGGANSTNNIIGGISLGNNGEEYAGLYAIDGGSSAATDLAFFVGDTNGINEAIHIDSGGTVQINSPASSGTRSLTVKLTDNTSGAAVFEQSSNEYLRINTTNGSEKIILGDNGTNPKINFNGEYDFPTADGSAGQVLTTDGSGTLSFSSAGSGTVSGSGTDNYIPRWNGTTALENSAIYDNGSSRISLGSPINTSPWQALHVQSTGSQFSDGASGNNNYNVVIIDQNAYTSNYGGGILFGGKYNSAGGTTTLAMVSVSKVNGDGNFGGKVHIGGREHGTSNIAKVLTVTHANVGIITTNPVNQLHVGDGTDNNTWIGVQATAGYYSGIKLSRGTGSWSSTANNNFGIIVTDAGIAISKFTDPGSNVTGRGDYLTVVNGGNVGIGTISPDNPLEVFGADSGIKISSASNNRPHLRLECGTAEKLRLSANTVYGAIGDSSDTNRYMVFKDGRVGINTATPGDKLHVYGGAAIFEDNGNNINVKNTWSSGNHDINFIGGSSVGGSATNTAARIRCLATAPGGAATGSLTFTVNSGDTFVDALYIKENGNVGVGTNAPVKKLDVRAAASWDGIHIGSTAGSATAIDFARSTTHANPTARIGVAEPGATHTSDMRFFTSDASGGAPNLVEKMRIDPNGKVGIGTTDPVNALHVHGSADGFGYIRITDGGLGATATDGARIGYNSSALRIQNYENSNISFFTNNTTEALTIQNDGNVGIGTNAPLDKLDVYGSGAVFRNLSDNADSVQIVRGTNHTASPDAKFYIYDNSSADWAAKINLDGASYGLDIQNGSDYFLLCRKVGGDRVLEVHGSSTVVNDAGIDYDFRVESNNDDFLLYTDGGNDRVAISTNTPAAKLHVEGDFKVGTTNNGNWMGYKDVSLNGNTYTTALTINLNNHTGCYVKLFLSGDWSSHSAVAFVGEYFIQNGSDGYAEPGTVISEFDNTNTDSIESKIVDPSSDTFTIQLKLSTAANGTLAGKLSYHVMGMATAVS